MSLKEHKDYCSEKKRLEETIEYVESSIAENLCNTESIRDETRKTFQQLDYRDSTLAYDEAALNAALYEMESKKYIGLVKARKKPYFSRIDIQQPDKKEIKKLYIGKMALTGEDIENPYIIDWRAPVASVYYNGRLGDVTYDSPGGTQDVKLHLKRQYTINEGILENIMDVDITTTDTFLQAALGENKDNRLQDIVSTIQAEQNDIIRADLYKPIIVQGVAGSGKTTIALHRIAYLIYTFENEFKPSQFLIIAPNRLFLNYISEVLPELGVEKVKQATFIDIAFTLLGEDIKLTDPDEKLIKFISKKNAKEEKDLTLLRRVIDYKCSLKFRDMIDNYVAVLEQSIIPDKDFCLDGHVILTADAIKQIVDKQFSYLPLYKKIPQLKNLLSKMLKRDSDIILGKEENDFNQQINNIRRTMDASPERKGKIIALMDAREEKLAAIKKEAKTAVAKYLSLLPKEQNISCYYKELVTRQESFTKYNDGSYDNEFIKYFCKHNLTHFRKNEFEFEDLAALLYLKHKLFSFEENENVDCKYIVIDEAQDFSLFQMVTLKEIYHTHLFTILGDLAQGIHSYRGIQSWQDVINMVFKERSCNYLTLNQSYRTTIEIMDVANEVIKKSSIPEIVLANPVVRHGEKPELFRFDSKTKMIDALKNKINERIKDGYKTIAVIGKSEQECTMLKDLLAKVGMVAIKQLGSTDTSYEGGITLVPSYLAKGLEFDAVIVCVYEDEYITEELDIKLLYVAMTRALHRLDVLYMDGHMSILEN